MSGPAAAPASDDAAASASAPVASAAVPRVPVDVTVVVPTVGRATLGALLGALDSGGGPAPVSVVVVDDRPGVRAPLDVPATVAGAPLFVRRAGGRGPAAARNVGWQGAGTEWVAFLDDDVVPVPGWLAQLERDLSGLPPAIGGVQGRVEVPRARGRRPTDWERNVVALEQGCWITADMAYRTGVLAAVGGFDPRFPRAFREDTELGLRVSGAGWVLVRGERRVWHPVRPADRWVSVRAQRGNRDDQLVRALHGPDWRARAAAGPGRTGRHLATIGSAGLALGGLACRRRALVLAGAGGWVAGTAELAWARIAPGPRTADEVGTMVATSTVLPWAALWHLAAGRLTRWWRLRRPGPRPGAVPRAVLFDRDGTLVEDEPYNGDPAAVRLRPGARQAIDRLRAAGVQVGVITNQSGVARGLLGEEDVRAVNRRVEELLGPMDAWEVCVHAPADRCTCRKPRPGMVRQAAAALGVVPGECAVVGDIGADVRAARAAGARAVLVPTPVTRRAEVRAAPHVATDLVAAVDLLLGATATGRPPGRPGHGASVGAPQLVGR